MTPLQIGRLCALLLLAQSAWDGIHYGWIVCAAPEPLSCKVYWLYNEQLTLRPGVRLYAPAGCWFENIPLVTLVCPKDRIS